MKEFWRNFKMTKAELISVVAEKTDLTKKDTDKTVTAIVDAITEALMNGDKVSIVGFGTFEVKDRAARKGINPRTKEPMPIPASKLPSFKAGKALKEAVAK
jgi:DNA-binding protein HU-beta